MNRLVIIGNGFDLAHGLPTSYKDFIDDFWKNFREKVKSEEYKKFIYADESYYQYYSDFGSIKNFEGFKSNIHKYIKDSTGFNFDEKKLVFSTNQNLEQKIIFKFKNEFFKIICNESIIENWSGIETIYYEILKGIAIPEKNLYKYPNGVQKLNEEFEDVKKLLIQYLEKKIYDKYEFSIDTDNEILSCLKSEIDNSDIHKNETYVTYFLSFNYTPTARLYSESLKKDLYKAEVNYIHGELFNSENPSIIFGFGDDMDKDYKTLKAKSNDFLENLKNHEYGEEENLENLIEFINSNKFKVLIMGHSCEISDRYILNQIFENINCQKIKIYYRVCNDEKDNYKDLARNISRHFNDDRAATTNMIDNKKKSERLSQRIKFKEKIKDDPLS